MSMSTPPAPSHCHWSSLVVPHPRSLVLVPIVTTSQAAYTFGGGASTSPGGDDGSAGGGGGVGAGAGGAGGGGGMGPPAALAEAWAPTAEQNHNLQLLELVAKLREALLGIPALIAPAGGVASATAGAAGAGATTTGEAPRQVSL